MLITQQAFDVSKRSSRAQEKGRKEEGSKQNGEILRQQGGVVAFSDRSNAEKLQLSETETCEHNPHASGRFAVAEANKTRIEKSNFVKKEIRNR